MLQEAFEQTVKIDLVRARLCFNRLKHLAQRPEGAVVIIGGPAASGKSTLAKALCGLSDVTALHLDLDYWRVKSGPDILLDAAYSGRHPMNRGYDPMGWLDWKKLRHDFAQLQAGRPVMIDGCYNSATDHLDGAAALCPPDKPSLLILEGNRALHPEMARLGDYSIYLDVPADQRRQRQITRDLPRCSAAATMCLFDEQAKWDQRYYDKYSGNIKLDVTMTGQLHSLVETQASLVRLAKRPEAAVIPSSLEKMALA